MKLDRDLRIGRIASLCLSFANLVGAGHGIARGEYLFAVPSLIWAASCAFFAWTARTHQRTRDEMRASAQASLDSVARFNAVAAVAAELARGGREP